MVMRKNDLEQDNVKNNNKDDSDDFMEESVADKTVDDVDIKLRSNNDSTVRKRLEKYLEKKRLRKELDDDLFEV